MALNALLKRVWIGLAVALIGSLAAAAFPDLIQRDDTGRIRLGAPAPSPSASAPTPESTSPPLPRDAVDEAIQTAIGAAGLDPAQGRPLGPTGADSDRTGWTAVRERTSAVSEMNAICADLERQGWTPNPNGDRPDLSRSYRRGSWSLLVSTRGKTLAPSTTSALTDSQTYLTVVGFRLNLSDIPLPEITVRLG
ncbi:hypothetical protein AW27_015915 [Streptomyces sp. PCS3-D2]|uniref:hypothetical protein n=1 Tax=Streptomyces sp. PCS3-D2 TaxID=1460244 RepID=UPI0012FEB065|nr:hypothetical protein [Streptomyces sp. PCS3-D2]WKV72889.1 hypothetical protein AW27_015915 [Streptomyces sp. PCS3-D2]